MCTDNMCTDANSPLVVAMLCNYNMATNQLFGIFKSLIDFLLCFAFFNVVYAQLFWYLSSLYNYLYKYLFLPLTGGGDPFDAYWQYFDSDDSDGNDSDGYDSDGYDSDGYDSDGNESNGPHHQQHGQSCDIQQNDQETRGPRTEPRTSMDERKYGMDS